MCTEPARAATLDDGALTMPHAADAHVPVRARSSRLVRALLLGACGTGLLGLGLPSSPATVAPTTSAPTISAASISAASAAGPSSDANEFRHTRLIAVPRVSTHRATRSRTVAVATRTTSVRPARTWFRPSEAAVVSPFGMRWGKLHKGIDFGAAYGTPIRAVGAGVVVGTGYQAGEGGYGQITLIRHSNGFVTAYAHQSRMSVSAGQDVTAGQIIGYIGSTGHSTGPHLHFEVRTSTHGGQVNPTPWLRSHGIDV